MYPLRSFIILSFTTLVVLTSCAPSVTIHRTVPAKYHITEIKRLAFTNFSYSTSYHEKGSEMIPKTLYEHLDYEEFFESVEAPETELEMDEELSIPEIKKIGRQRRADAVVTGEVMAYQVDTAHSYVAVEEEVETGRYRTEEYEENGEKKYRRVPIKEKVTTYQPFIQKEAEVSFYLDLVHTRTGKVLDHDYYSRRGREEAQGEDKIRDLPADQQMLLGVTENLAEIFVKKMMPHEVSEKIRFKKDKPCKDGIKQAQKNNWQEAVASWNAALAADSTCHCALYNLGLERETNEAYTEALSYYQKATGIVPDEKLYSNAVRRIEKKMKQEKILKEQMKGR